MPNHKSSSRGQPQNRKSAASPPVSGGNGSRSSKPPAANNRSSMPGGSSQNFRSVPSKPSTASGKPSSPKTVKPPAHGPPKSEAITSRSPNIPRAPIIGNGALQAAQSRPSNLSGAQATKGAQKAFQNPSPNPNATGSKSNQLRKTQGHTQTPPTHSSTKQPSITGKPTSSKSQAVTPSKPVVVVHNSKPGLSKPHATDASRSKNGSKAVQGKSTDQPAVKHQGNGPGQTHPQRRQIDNLHPGRIDVPASRHAGNGQVHPQKQQTNNHHPGRSDVPAPRHAGNGQVHPQKQQTNNRHPGRSDMSSYIKSVPHPNKSSPSNRAESTSKGNQHSNPKATADRSPNGLGSKHASNKSSAVHGGSPHRTPSVIAQEKPVPSRQETAKSAELARGKHFNVNPDTAKQVLNSINHKASSHPQAAKRQLPNGTEGAKKSMATSREAVNQTANPGIFNRISSFFGWTASANQPISNSKTVQGAKGKSFSEPLAPTLTSSKEGSPNHLPKSHAVKDPPRKPLKLSAGEPVLSAESAKKGRPVGKNQSTTPLMSTNASGWPWAMQWFTTNSSKAPVRPNNSTISEPSPKTEQTASHIKRASKAIQRDAISSPGASHVSAKSGTSTNRPPNHEPTVLHSQFRLTQSPVTTAQSPATSGSAKNRSGESSKSQLVQCSSVPKVNRAPVRRRERPRSSPSKVFSGSKRSLTLRHRDLLRQYSRDLIWRNTDRPRVISADATETAAPLPSPPRNELRNKVARKTIAKNPHLFQIKTPINVDRFEEFLADHPNQPFVKSVVRGLRKGFWPWADTSDPRLPTTHDNSSRPIRSRDEAKFIRQQRDEEVKLGRWSKSFGQKLLPGMYSSPISAVPKSTPGKFRLIVDQSKGRHSLNSMIPRSQVKIKLDDIHDLGSALIAVRKRHGKKRKLVVFKSDVKSAYRLMPMHPLWQIRQVATVDGKRYVDRCNSFGSRAGGWIWDSFISLVLWIGKEKGIPDLLGYVDDDFSWEFEKNKKFYKPYKKYLPAKQARYLELWDKLGIPHEEDKQLFGSSLPIIGYDVDPNKMIVGVPTEKMTNVVRLIRSVAHEGKTCTLEQLQSTAGSISAVLNIYPHLRPRLHTLFNEMAGKEGSRTKLQVTKPIARNLQRLANYLEHAEGVPIQTITGEAGSSKPEGS